jgi:hypothetical protein
MEIEKGEKRKEKEREREKNAWGEGRSGLTGLGRGSG